MDVYETTKNNTLRVVALRGVVRLLGLGSRPAEDTLKVCGELLRGAKQPGEKKLILAVLARVSEPDAIKMVEPLLREKQVKAEAELAMLGIAKAIVVSAPGRAKSAARVLLETSANPSIRKEAKGIINLIENSGTILTPFSTRPLHRRMPKPRAYRGVPCLRIPVAAVRGC